ncbi:MAG: LysR family transcriptional regulator [Epulopiscium sp.]|nr:LysR family transcriptional regulator [Candidatus Epulonipiscium sp.]
MNISYLNQFVEVVKLGSISKAAEKNHLSQPALSQQIKLMEQMLNSTLLERSNRGVTLTQTGEIVYKHAIQMMSIYDQMLKDIDDVKNQSKVFQIFATPTICDYALPCTIYHIKEKYPQFTLKLYTMPSGLVEDNIACGQGNIGFISGKPRNNTLVSKKVFSDHICLVAGANMPVPKHIKKEDIYNYPLIMLNQSQYTRRTLDTYLEEVGINLSKLKVLYSLDSIESIKSSATRGFGLAFLPYMTIKKELYNKQLFLIDMEDFKLENSFYIVSKPLDEPLDKDIGKLSGYIEKILAETIC